MENKTTKDKTTKDKRVAIVNELNESIFNGFSKIDFDFFFIFMNRLKNKMCVSIPYEDIKHLFPKRPWRNDAGFNRVADEVCKKIMFTGIIPFRPSEDKKGYISLFDYVYADYSKGCFDIKVKEKYRDYFVEYWEHYPYTSIDLAEFISLKSKYTKTLYRMCKQYYKTAHFYIKAEDFQRIMDFPKTYSHINIMQRVINPALEELRTLDAFSDISVEIKRKGNGKRTEIISYDFKFLNKKKIKEVYGDSESEEKVDESFEGLPFN